MFCAYTRPRYQVSVTGPLFLWFEYLVDKFKMPKLLKGNNSEKNAFFSLFNLITYS